jgi:hypothetical protein
VSGSAAPREGRMTPRRQDRIGHIDICILKNGHQLSGSDFINHQVARNGPLLAGQPRAERASNIADARRLLVHVSTGCDPACPDGHTTAPSILR